MRLDNMDNREKLLKLLEEHDDIRIRLYELFVKEHVVLRWLAAPRAQLGQKSPAQCLKDNPDLVKELLDRISQGDFS